MLMDDMISIGRSQKAGRIVGKILGSGIIHKSFDGANGELRFQTLNFDPAVFFCETSSINCGLAWKKERCGKSSHGEYRA